MQENKTTTKLLKRIEILGEAVQTALEAVLEIQVEQKLITYLLAENKEKNLKKSRFSGALCPLYL